MKRSVTAKLFRGFDPRPIQFGLDELAALERRTLQGICTIRLAYPQSPAAADLSR